MEGPADERGRLALVVAVLALLAGVWGAQVRGLVSSNDGSHLALARALAVHHRTTLDDEVALTLRVDVARRDGRWYSDRPPGTAFAAAPAVWAGAKLDDALSGELDPIVPVAVELYAHTYRVRFRGRARPLEGLVGTSVLVGLHTVTLGLLAVGMVWLTVVHLGVSVRAGAIAAATLGLATLLGPYTTVLFSHGSAAAAMALLLYALARARDAEVGGALRWEGVAGMAGSWAVACDYLTLVAVVPLVAVSVAPRRWPVVLAATLPIALAVAVYHAHAFGSPLSIGYDHHANFAFARDRSETFVTPPHRGLWVLLGFGRGAGALSLAPIAVVGWVAAAADPRTRRWALAFVPWLLALSTHRTPWGGAAEDHRYLLPAVPLAGVGLALAWERIIARRGAWGIAAATALVVLSVFSAWRVWTRYFEGHEGAGWTSPELGVLAAAVVALPGLVLLGRRAWKPPPQNAEKSAANPARASPTE